jgi:acetyl/propionyl-CoA carboxylase alpha subunit
MLAKVIAHGATRDEACRTLARALADAHVHGVTTNRDLLVGVLREQEFRRGEIDTGYLTRHDPAVLCARPEGEIALRVHPLAAALAGSAQRRAAARVQTAVPPGWRNVPNGDQLTQYALGDSEIDVRYRSGRDGLRASVAGEPVDVADAYASPDRVTLTVDGVRRTVDVHRVGAAVYLDSPLGSTALREVERFPEPQASEEAGSLHAPMPGTVVRVEVAEGQPVAAGAVVVVLEAMKMEHAVRAPHDGVVATLSATVGQTVDTGEVLAVVHDVDAEQPS